MLVVLLARLATCGLLDAMLGGVVVAGSYMPRVWWWWQCVVMQAMHCCYRVMHDLAIHVTTHAYQPCHTTTPLRLTLWWCRVPSRRVPGQVGTLLDGRAESGLVALGVGLDLAGTHCGSTWLSLSSPHSGTLGLWWWGRARLGLVCVLWFRGSLGDSSGS